MRGFAFLLDAFFALLLVGFFAQLPLPPQPDFQTLHLLRLASNLSSDASDAMITSGTLRAPEGFCLRISGNATFQSCEAENWAGVPRTVFAGGRFTLYRVFVGFPKRASG